MQNHDQTNDDLPAPCRAATELPDQVTLEAARINLDLETARLVLSALSRQAGRGRSKTRTNLYDTIMGLVFVGRQPIERNGVTEAAPFPDLPVDRWPQGREVFRRLGISNRQLEAYFRAARRGADDACLPLEWALAFFPAAIWPMIAQLIRWGPERVGLRMEWAVTTMVETKTQRNRRRRAAGEPLSDSVIDHYIGGVWQLMDVLLELRSIATNSPVLPLGLLDAWTTKPKRLVARDYGARPAGIDNSGPSLDACSARLKVLQAEARVTTQRNGYLKRRRALFMPLVCMFGPRGDAFLKSRIEDYLPNHVYPDGTSGPALRIFPGKTWEPDEALYLPLPDEVARWLEDWITFTGRRLGQPNEPIFPNKKPRPGRAGHFLTGHGLYNAIAGTHQKGGTGSYALLPRGDDPFIGFHPHAFRHTALQLAVRAAANLQRADATFFPHVHPQEFGKAIVGHALVTEIGGIYRDLDRQLLCRAIVDEMWRLLYDDGILRRGPDPDRVRQARELCDALRITRDAVRRDMLDLEGKAEQTANRAGGIRDTSRKLQRQLQAAQHQLAAHARRDELGRLEQSLQQAEVEFNNAKIELVPIAEYLCEAEHARRLVEALGDAPETHPTRASAALADEISVKDAAELFGVDEHTINRWRNHGFPKHRPLPWHGGEDAWHDDTQKDRRLRVTAINMVGLTDDQKQCLELIRLRRAREDNSRRKTPTEPAHGALIDGHLDTWDANGSSPSKDEVSNPSEAKSGSDPRAL
jgi:hypothetical protein